MRKVIHTLRQRPHHERRAIASGVAVSTTGVLLMGWLFFSLRSGSNSAPVQVAAQTSVVAAVEVTQQQTPAAASESPLVQYLTSDSATSSAADTPSSY